MSSKIDPGPRDPQGFYIITTRRDLYERIASRIGAERVVVEEVGETVILKTRSRSTAVKVLRLLNNIGEN